MGMETHFCQGILDICELFIIILGVVNDDIIRHGQMIQGSRWTQQWMSLCTLGMDAHLLDQDPLPVNFIILFLTGSWVVTLVLAWGRGWGSGLLECLGNMIHVFKAGDILSGHHCGCEFVQVAGASASPECKINFNNEGGKVGWWIPMLRFECPPDNVGTSVDMNDTNVNEKEKGNPFAI